MQEEGLGREAHPGREGQADESAGDVRGRRPTGGDAIGRFEVDLCLGCLGVAAWRAPPPPIGGLVMAEPGLTPTSPQTVVVPVFVTVSPPSTE